MIHQPPAGARDLLPLEVAQKSWINDTLQRVFQRWGYQRIVTSTLEWIDTLVAGGAIEAQTVIQLKHSQEGDLGLRPELTASLARVAVTRMAGGLVPQRLCYRANVFRNPPQGHHGSQLEFYQAGVELLFANSNFIADSEILLLFADALENLGLESWQLVLGEANLTRSLLDIFPEDKKQKVRHCLATLDRLALEQLDLTAEQRERALGLFDLRGEPHTVLAQLEAFSLDEQGRHSIENLKALMALLDGAPQKLPIILDLSFIQSFDYYTGIIFEGVCCQGGQTQVIGQGGRYDRLLGIYHPQQQDFAGVGFSFNLEAIHSCLLGSPQLPQRAHSSDYLVIAETPEAATQAFQVANQLRQDTHKSVELALGDRQPEQIKRYAQESHIGQLVWVSATGEQRTESLSP